MDYYRHVAAGEGPRVVVIQDLDPEPGIGAFWGEVNTAIHLGLGCVGVLTDGSIRDLGAVAPGFQLLAGSIMPSHAHVHVTGFGEPVTVFGLAVADGDLIHMDRHGAVIIPPGAERELPAAIRLDIAKEAPILRAARASGFTIETLMQAFAEADDVH
jgi:regulator of RNase E activity RraA